MHSSGVKHTCPDIDRIKKNLLQMVKEMDYYKNSGDLDTIQNFLNSSASELYYMTDDLEDLRSSNESLRAWGEGLLEEKGILEEEIATLNDQIDSMVENL